MSLQNILDWQKKYALTQSSAEALLRTEKLIRASNPVYKAMEKNKFYTTANFPTPTIIEMQRIVENLHDRILPNLDSFQFKVPKYYEAAFSAINSPTFFSQNPFIYSAKWNNIDFALTGLHDALAKLSIPISGRPIIEEEWNQIIGAASGITATITEEERITPQHLDSLKSLFQRAVAFYQRQEKGAGTKTLLFIVIISFAFDIINQINALQDQPELVTKEEFRVFQKQILDTLHTTLARESEYRQIEIRCPVKLSPKAKSLTIDTLSKGAEIILVQTHHKWAYVLYSDQNELPIHGWIMKKYLRKRKKHAK